MTEWVNEWVMDLTIRLLHGKLVALGYLVALENLVALGNPESLGQYVENRRWEKALVSAPIRAI